MSSWICPKCTYNNVPDDFKCDVCRTPNPLRQQVQCTQCTLENDIDNKFCTLCEARLPTIIQATVNQSPLSTTIDNKTHNHPSSTAVDNKTGPNIKTTKCNVCSFENILKATRCGNCLTFITHEYIIDHKTIPPFQQFCLQCGTRHPENNLSCECVPSREPLLWYCSCGSRNTAQTTACLGCFKLSIQHHMCYVCQGYTNSIIYDRVRNSCEYVCSGCYNVYTEAKRTIINEMSALINSILPPPHINYDDIMEKAKPFICSASDETDNCPICARPLILCPDAFHKCTPECKDDCPHILHTCTLDCKQNCPIVNHNCETSCVVLPEDRRKLIGHTGANNVKHNIHFHCFRQQIKAGVSNPGKCCICREQFIT